MSEQVNETAEPSQNQEQNQPPQDVIQLQKTMQDLSVYRNMLDLGSFDGKYAEVIVQFRGFMSNLLKQVNDAFQAHPYVKAILDAQAKEEAEEAKEAANEPVEIIEG